MCKYRARTRAAYAYTYKHAHITRTRAQHRATWLQTSETKGRNQLAAALTASSAVKTAVKRRLAASSAADSSVGPPSAVVSSEMNSDSMMVHPKFWRARGARWMQARARARVCAHVGLARLLMRAPGHANVRALACA